MADVVEILAQFWPLVALQVVLTAAALVDISRHRHFRYLPRAGWVMVSVFLATLGPMLYFLVGRGEE